MKNEFILMHSSTFNSMQRSLAPLINTFVQRDQCPIIQAPQFQASPDTSHITAATTTHKPDF